VIVCEFEVEWRGDEPYVRQEESAGRAVQRRVRANVAGPEAVGEDPFWERPEKEIVGEFEQVQIHLLRAENVEAHHLVAMYRTGAHRASGHPEVTMDSVQPV